MEKALPPCGFAEHSSRLCTTHVSPSADPKLRQVTRAPPMMEGAHLELKAPWGKSDNAL